MIVHRISRGADEPGLRLAIVVALAAFEIGDNWYGVDVLLQALEDEPRVTRCYCECGQGFEWPGLLAAHRDKAGHWLLDQAA
jgi:hypothetical protein